MLTPFQLPRLTNPKQYEGLYAVHFPHGVSVGYTLEEIQTLQTEPEYADVRVYRIHRVDDHGNIELAGVSPRDLAAEDTILFASADPKRATRDFAALQQHAASHPLPSPARLELIDLPDQNHPHAVSLTYPRAAGPAVTTWLQSANFTPGETAIGGAEAKNLRRQAPADPIASANLPSQSQHSSRTREQVLACVHDPLQR